MRMIVSKPGITIDIPRFGDRCIKTIVSDYTGTHYTLSPFGIRRRMCR
jgi:hypothetical protein